MTLRRAACALVLLAAMVAVLPRAAAPTSPDSCPGPAAAVGSATDLGVRVFPQYSDTPYGQHPAVLQDLGRLGVTRVSGLLTPSMEPEEVAFYRKAHDCLGIKVWFAAGSPGQPLTDAQWQALRDLLSGPLHGVTEVVSGWNEPNHRVEGGWVTPTAAHQNRLWKEVQRVNATTGQHIRVGTPPLWSGDVEQQYEDLVTLAPAIRGSYDVVNFHLYPHGASGERLEAMVDRQVQEITAAYGRHPLLNSESGYFTASAYRGGSNPSTEAEQAAHLAGLVAIHRSRGIALSYFELLDDPDPSQADREAHFGLIRTRTVDPDSWSDKPAFAVMQRLAEADD